MLLIAWMLQDLYTVLARRQLCTWLYLCSIFSGEIQVNLARHLLLNADSLENLGHLGCQLQVTIQDVGKIDVLDYGVVLVAKVTKLDRC